MATRSLAASEQETSLYPVPGMRAIRWFAMIALGFSLTAFILLHQTVWGIAASLVSIAAANIGWGWKIAAANPPTGALIVSFDKPPGRAQGSGWFFHFFWENVYAIPLGEQTLEIKPESDKPVITKDGGKFLIEAFVRFHWNLDDPYQIVRIGGYEGVKERLRETIEAAIREYAATVTWEKALSDKRTMTKILYRLIVQLEDGDMENDDVKDAVVESDRIARKDAQGLGMIISRLSVTRVNPTGRLEVVIDQIVEEERQQKAETLDQKTRAKLVAVILTEAGKRGEPITYEDALTLVTDWQLVKEGHGDIKRIPGLDRFGQGLGEAIARLLTNK